MKRNLLLTGAVVLIALLGGLGYAYLQASSSAVKQNLEAKQQNDLEPSPVARSARLVEPGVYTTYKDGSIASAKGTILLFFHAPWCPQCRMIEDDINQNGLPDGVTVLKVDFDSSNELRKKYEVTLQTTFIKVNSDGDMLAKYVAYNEPSFDSVKKNLLD